MTTPQNTPRPDHLIQVHGYNDEVEERVYSVRKPEQLDTCARVGDFDDWHKVLRLQPQRTDSHF